MQQAQALASLEDRILAQTIKTTARAVKENYRPLIQALAAATTPQTPEHLASTLGIGVNQVKDRLGKLVKAQPKLIEETAEFLPDASTMIGFVKDELGSYIVSGNLAEANRICSRLVEKIIVPRHRSFLQREIAKNIDAAGNVNVKLDDLVEFLREDYVEFVKAQGQGLTSRAGRLNEELIRQSMLSAGLKEGEDFTVTGTKSEGDIVVYHKGKLHKNLAIEVKSYGARERLLRGLHDAPAPKIGVGFFNMASEFNDTRTIDFLKTGALAIYLPAATLAGVDTVAKGRTNTLGTVFYRPLDQLATDLLGFKANGEAAY